jgi:hypothetical protein
MTTRLRPPPPERSQLRPTASLAPMARPTSLALALTLLVASCTGANPGSKDVVRGSSRPSPETTTTTTIPDPVEAVLSPLTGLPVDDPELLDRRVLAVKVDNHPLARPQSGLQDADVVLELLVEGGFTRFIALFHANDTEYVGPIRSLRPNDPQVVAALGATVAISGGQPWILSIAAGHGVGLVGEGPGMFRVSGRPAPHDLYGATPLLRDAADMGGHPDDPPEPWMPIGEWQEPAETASDIAIHWSIGDAVEWRYDATDGVYRRWTNGVPHRWIDRDGVDGQVEADVLVVIGSRFYVASPPPGFEGSSVPSVDTVGAGPAWVFARGRAWVGTWRRDLPTDPFTLLGDDGAPVTVPAGRSWISFPPEGQPVEFG